MRAASGAGRTSPSSFLMMMVASASSSSPLSGAASLLVGETDGLAVAFTDATAVVLDSADAGNNYSGAASGINVGPGSIPDADPTGVAFSTTAKLQTSAFGSLNALTVVATFYDGGTTFKAGATVGEFGTFTAWDGTAGASVPGGLSGACNIVDVLVLPSGVSQATLESMTGA